MPKQKLKLPKIENEDVLSKLDLIENENIYFEDINDLDKYLDSIDNLEYWCILNMGG